MGSPFDNHLVDDEKFMQAAAATARELRKRIAELEAALADIHSTARRHSFACEWFLQGVRHDPGDYVLMRVGPATKTEHQF